MGQMQNLGHKIKFLQSTIKWVSNFECDFQPEASGGHIQESVLARPLQKNSAKIVIRFLFQFDY